MTYRIYISEGIKAITQNTVNISGNGINLNKSLYDMLYPREIPEETRTEEEIIDYFKDRLGKL